MTTPPKHHAALAVHHALINPDATITFEIPPTWWMSANRHTKNHQYLGTLRRNLHALAVARARQEGLRAFDSACLVWEISYPKGTAWTTGDPTNTTPTTKPLLDGLVKAGIFPDDSPAYIAGEFFTRGPNHKDRSGHTVTLHIKEIEK